MNVDLVINNLPVILGSDKDVEALFSSGFQKLGFFSRLRIKPPAGGSILWSKNCHFSYLDKQLEAYAVLDVPKEEMEFMCGTSAYLFFAPDGLDKVICQVIASRLQAMALSNDLKKLLKARFGEPIIKQIHLSVWEDDKSQFICELNKNKTNAYFHWLRKSE